jgi:hypothetical protein
VCEGNHIVSYCTASVTVECTCGNRSHSSRKATVRCSSLVASVQGICRSWNILMGGSLTSCDRDIKKCKSRRHCRGNRGCQARATVRLSPWRFIVGVLENRQHQAEAPTASSSPPSQHHVCAILQGLGMLLTVAIGRQANPPLPAPGACTRRSAATCLHGSPHLHHAYGRPLR